MTKLASSLDFHYPQCDHRQPHRLWSIQIDPVTMPEAVARIAAWIEQKQLSCHFVVTPNVDHVVQLYRNTELRHIYNNASLVLADGWPLVTMSKVYNKRLPERVPGSDLLPAILNDYQLRDTNLKIFLLGGKTGVPERAAENIQRTWSRIKVVGTCSPDFGFEKDPTACDRVVEEVNQSGADLLVVGLGAPKQELWLNSHCSRLKVSVALAIGATIDFFAGEQKRAPLWVQRLKMEWLQRLISDPRRLAKRYATDAVYFPYICMIEMLKKSDENGIRIDGFSADRGSVRESSDK